MERQRESPLHEDFFRRIVEQVGDMIVVTRRDGTILFANRQTAWALGYGGDDLAGWSLFELLHDDDRARVEELFHRGADDACAQLSLVAKIRRHDGTWHTVDALVHGLLDGAAGGAAGGGGFIVTLRDVSERRKVEQQSGRAQRMEALGRLACAVAHDFNNLLTAILGYADLLHRTTHADSPHQGQIEEIRKAGLKAAALTRQLLTFGRGKVLDLKIVQLNHVITDMRALLTQIVGERVVLDLDLDAEVDPVRIDRSQLEQVILNLVANAREAMRGEGRLTIRTLSHRVEQPFVLHHDRVEPGRYTMLAVRDTGCGIDPKIMDHLFEPFFTTKEPGAGTGLGLSAVYGIVKQNGGFISVYNEPQGGVTFKVSFAGVEAGKEPERAPDLAAVVGAHRRPRTVLLAEDDGTVRRLMAETLRMHGYDVLAAHDGLSALELADAHPGSIDLLLTDVSMPRMDGVALANRLVARGSMVPILLVSGTARAEAIELDGEAPYTFLEKPFTPTELIRKVRELL